jgi:hypothetical protein
MKMSAMSSEPYEIELARIAASVASLAGLTDAEIADQADRTWLISRRIDEAEFRDIWIRCNAVCMLAIRQQSTDPTLAAAVDYLHAMLYREW